MYPLILERNIYLDPIHNTACKRHFICGAAKCPKDDGIFEQNSCYIDRSTRHQPDVDASDTDIWFDAKMKKIDRDSTNDSWMAILVIIFIFALFGYMLSIFYKFYVHH